MPAPRHVDNTEEEGEIDVTASRVEIDRLDGELARYPSDLAKYPGELEFTKSGGTS